MDSVELPTDQELIKYFAYFSPTDNTLREFRNRWLPELVIKQPEAGHLQIFKDGRLIMGGPQFFVNHAMSNFINYIARNN